MPETRSCPLVATQPGGAKAKAAGLGWGVWGLGCGMGGVLRRCAIDATLRHRLYAALRYAAHRRCAGDAFTPPGDDRARRSLAENSNMVSAGGREEGDRW